MKLFDLHEVEEEYISLKTSKLAKEKKVLIFGINTKYWKEKLYKSYDDEGNEFAEEDVDRYLNGIGKETHYLAPTQSLLQRFLREKHDILVYCLPYKHEKELKWTNNIAYRLGSIYFNTYEEALEDGLQRGLTLIK